MPSLLSGSTLRRGGSGEFIDLASAMPQLPATDTTETGFTIATNDLLQTTYRSSLGYIQMTTGSMYSLLPEGTIRVLATGTSFLSTTTSSGNLVVRGGIGVGGNMHIEEDIVINGVSFGRGWEGYNNIAIRGTAEIPPNDFQNGQESIAIGFDTMLGLDTSNRCIAIGRYALNSGTQLSNTLAIGDGSLKTIGSIHSIPAGAIVSATNTNPIVLTVLNHNLSSGTYVVLTDVQGMTEINSQSYYISYLSTDTVALYSGPVLTTATSVDGTGFGTYTFTATSLMSRVLQRYGNIAYGVESGLQLVDGRENVFIGHQAARNMTTGSYNIIIGHNIIPELTTGSGIISIGGDNIVDGLNNQVNIGSVFYFDGTGYASINAETTIGLGTESTGTDTGGVMVIGGIGIRGNINAGGIVNFLGTGTSTIASSLVPSNLDVSLGSLDYPFKDLYLSGTTLYVGGIAISSPSSQNIVYTTTSGPVTIESGNLILNSGVAAVSTTTGALHIEGGLSANGDIWITGSLYSSGVPVLTTETFAAAIFGGEDITITDIGGGILEFANTSTFQTVTSRGNTTTSQLFFLNTSNSTSTTTGAIVVTGGIGVGGRVTSESLRIADTILDSTLSTVNTTATTLIDTFNITEFRSAKYFIQIESGSGVSSQYHVQEVILLANNNNQVYATEYGVVTTSGQLGEFAVENLSGTVNFYFIPYAATSKTIKVLRTGMAS